MLVTPLLPGLVRFPAREHEPDYLEHLVRYGYDRLLVASCMLNSFIELSRLASGHHGSQLP